MVGGGIFAVLGLTIDLSRGGAPIAFIIAGVLALITAYSYVKLSLRYPSEGGTIEFIVQAFGNGLFSSIINNLLLISYVIMLALYAYAFGSYGAVLFGDGSEWVHKALSSGVILLFIFINILGAFLTGRAEDIMVFAKIIILLVFAAVGIMSINWTHMAPQEWMPLPSVAAGGFMIFLAYEGFELIANTARDVKDPQVNLPRAYYASVIFVILLYIVISAVAVGNLSFAEAKSAQDYVLAKAAEPFFGHIGFIFISIAALLSTASAINATIYGSGRISYIVAKLGELPIEFETKIKHGYEGMAIIGILAIIFTTLFNLNNISVAGSIGFLTVFALVNFANFKLYQQTSSNRFIPAIGTILCSGAAVTLIGYNIQNSPDSLYSSLVVLFSVLILSYLYNHLKGKKLAAYIDKELEREERLLKELL
ncbi:APC family permease [bacterium]|nr:APC family permease [bacterium]MBU1882719.1 APC family permease [bacterium]